jgi:hypothetical protein
MENLTNTALRIVINCFHKERESLGNIDDIKSVLPVLREDTKHLEFAVVMLEEIAVDAMNSFITKHATTQADNRVIHHMFDILLNRELDIVGRSSVVVSISNGLLLADVESFRNEAFQIVNYFDAFISTKEEADKSRADTNTCDQSMIMKAHRIIISLGMTSPDLFTY